MLSVMVFYHEVGGCFCIFFSVFQFTEYKKKEAVVALFLNY